MAMSAESPMANLCRAANDCIVAMTTNETPLLATLMTLAAARGHDVASMAGAATVMPKSVKEFRPDVVVLDIALPDGSWLRIAKLISPPQRSRQCPLLIALTGVYIALAAAASSRDRRLRPLSYTKRLRYPEAHRT